MRWNLVSVYCFGAAVLAVVGVWSLFLGNPQHPDDYLEAALVVGSVAIPLWVVGGIALVVRWKKMTRAQVVVSFIVAVLGLALAAAALSVSTIL